MPERDSGRDASLDERVPCALDRFGVQHGSVCGVARRDDIEVRLDVLAGKTPGGGAGAGARGFLRRAALVVAAGTRGGARVAAAERHADAGRAQGRRLLGGDLPHERRPQVAAKRHERARAREQHVRVPTRFAQQAPRGGVVRGGGGVVRVAVNGERLRRPRHGATRQWTRAVAPERAPKRREHAIRGSGVHGRGRAAVGGSGARRESGAGATLGGEPLDYHVVLGASELNRAEHVLESLIAPLGREEPAREHLGSAWSLARVGREQRGDQGRLLRELGPEILRRDAGHVSGAAGAALRFRRAERAQLDRSFHAGREAAEHLVEHDAGAVQVNLRALM